MCKMNFCATIYQVSQVRPIAQVSGAAVDLMDDDAMRAPSFE